MTTPAQRRTTTMMKRPAAHSQSLPDTSQRSPNAVALLKRIESKTATVGVIGLGYVGLPLVRAIFDAGFPIIGYDIDQTKIDKLKRGENYIQHIGDDLAATLSESERFEATADGDRLRDADVILLCVPTPLGKSQQPDLSYVLNSTRLVAGNLRLGQLIVLESTTYPGTTRGEMKPILEETELRCGEDFFLAYSPERENPGDVRFNTADIPKLVGGVDETSSHLATAFYSRVVKTVHRVSSAEIAETAKLLENIYRAVNIALVNEMKTLLTDMGIDVWEVIGAASTKPFGFQPFYPGPGLGGHCIPIDPFYLTWKAREMGRHTKFIELAGEINKRMPEYVVSRVIAALNEDKKALRGAKLLIIGIAYKPNIDDIRESPAAEIIELLLKGGATVSYHDPHIQRFPSMRDHDINLASIPLNAETITQQDCVLIVTDHDLVDYASLAAHASLVVDTRNAMERHLAESAMKPMGRVVKA